MAGDVVYLNTDDGLCAFRASSVELLWKEKFWEVDWSGPTALAVSGSVLFAGADRLYALTSMER